MRFIDKTIHQTEGNQHLDTFLNNQWDNATNSYRNIGYIDTPFKQLLKQPLKLLLLEEQGYVCCYCMRKLANDNNTTLEHVVPRSTNSQAQLNTYLHYATVNGNVCLQSVFNNANTKLPTPPYPLEIAYENLTASCKGDFPGSVTYHICNHKRGNEYIELLFYVPTIEQEIRYQKAGLLLPLNTNYDNSIVVLNLNYDSLEHIRQVWYHLSGVSMTEIELITTESERNEILTINLIGLPAARRNQLIADFKTEIFWDILMQYSWFHLYYTTQYPLEHRY